MTYPFFFYIILTIHTYSRPTCIEGQEQNPALSEPRHSKNRLSAHVGFFKDIPLCLKYNDKIKLYKW